MQTTTVSSQNQSYNDLFILVKDVLYVEILTSNYNPKRILA